MLLFSLVPFYFCTIFLLNKDLFFKHLRFLKTLFPEFFDKKTIPSFKECLSLVLRVLVFANLFLPSKILLHNGVRERSEFFFFVYTFYLAMFCFVSLFGGGIPMMFGLSYLFLLVETTVIGLFWEYNEGFRLYFSKLFPINIDLNHVIAFYLGNPSSNALRGGICFGTLALAGGGLCFQWARECAISTAAGDLFMETCVADIKGSIKDFSKDSHLMLEQIETTRKQIEFDRVKNFEYYREKGFSLEQAFSKAESIADKGYCSVQENYSAVSQEAPKHLSTETLRELVEMKGDVMETSLKKQPIHRFLDVYEVHANLDLSLKQKK